ncbi:unnamed protein product [Caenorhabditis auriculariae]|uniref:Acyl_transf_3 domain-containing protein n=1 Tax=Caenorhabditis auriculariae TaxID=2777116 RepID=A0A8S1GTD7_9PELO|nr:unnamed protein product [Caenorhabditis auriculariae]
MRRDVQCLRAVAIISVLLYHLFPTLFPNGFLGVDVFFVISGYIMARKLSKDTVFKFKFNYIWNTVVEAFDFYYRRIKRICPMYYLFVAATMVAVHLWQSDSWWPTNYRYSLASLFFITNQLIIHDSGDYFKEFLADGTSMNTFVHCWSLGVEMQFYLLVPLIFIGLSLFKSDLIKLLSVSIGCLSGLVLFNSINQQFAFNFMFARLWQFFAGFVAFYAAKCQMSLIPKKKDSEQLDLSNVSVAALLLCFFPMEISAVYLRPFITFLAAFVIYSEMEKNNRVLRSKVLHYIGDLSYTIYLIHWPIITIFRSSSLQSKYFCVAVTILLAVFLHELFEKNYLKLGPISAISLIVVLIGMNAWLQYSIRTHDFWKTSYSEETMSIVTANRRFMDPSWVRNNCQEMKPVPEVVQPSLTFGHCVFAPGKGNLTVLLIGNSYTLNQAEVIRQQFNENYSTFQYLSLDKNFAISAFPDDISRNALVATKRVVSEVQPDLLFIVHRMILQQPALTNVQEDPILAEYNENLNHYQKFAKKILIMDAHPYYPINFLNFFIEYVISRPQDLEQLHLDKKVADKAMSHAKKRLKNIKCDKCEVYDLSEPFLEQDKYLAFDRDTSLSYIDNGIHFTEEALKLIAPFYKSLISRVVQNLN